MLTINTDWCIRWNSLGPILTLLKEARRLGGLDLVLLGVLQCWEALSWFWIMEEEVEGLGVEGMAIVSVSGAHWISWGKVANPPCSWLMVKDDCRRLVHMHYEGLLLVFENCGMKKVERFCFFSVDDISICVNECSLPVIFPGCHELESRSSYLIKWVWENSYFIILWNSLCKAELLCSLKV